MRKTFIIVVVLIVLLLKIEFHCRWSEAYICDIDYVTEEVVIVVPNGHMYGYSIVDYVTKCQKMPVINDTCQVVMMSDSFNDYFVTPLEDEIIDVK